MKENKIRHKFNGCNITVIIRDDVDLSVFNEIFKYREYKSCEDIIVKANNPIIDLGAHVGFFSIYSNCLNKNVKIYAIEPEKNNIEYLSLNKKENEINNIKIVECAILDKSCNGKLVIEKDSINNYIVSSEGFYDDEVDIKKNKIQDVKILSLEDFLIDKKINKVSLLKMDIEGGEYKIFEFMDKKVFNKIENIFLEYHLDLDKSIEKSNDYNEKFLENIFRTNGFSVQLFSSGFDKSMGFILARNKRL